MCPADPGPDGSQGQGPGSLAMHGVSGERPRAPQPDAQLLHQSGSPQTHTQGCSRAPSPPPPPRGLLPSPSGQGWQTLSSLPAPGSGCSGGRGRRTGWETDLLGTRPADTRAPQAPAPAQGAWGRTLLTADPPQAEGPSQSSGRGSRAFEHQLLVPEAPISGERHEGARPRERPIPLTCPHLPAAQAELAGGAARGRLPGCLLPITHTSEAPAPAAQHHPVLFHARQGPAVAREGFQ